MTVSQAAAFPVPNLKKKPNSPRTLFSASMSVVAGLCALLALIPLFAVLIYVLIKGVGTLSPSLFVQLPPPPLVKGVVLAMRWSGLYLQ